MDSVIAVSNTVSHPRKGKNVKLTRYVVRNKNTGQFLTAGWPKVGDSPKIYRRRGDAQSSLNWFIYGWSHSDKFNVYDFEIVECTVEIPD